MHQEATALVHQQLGDNGAYAPTIRRHPVLMHQQATLVTKGLDVEALGLETVVSKFDACWSLTLLALRPRLELHRE